MKADNTEYNRMFVMLLNLQCLPGGYKQDTLVNKAVCVY